MALLDDVTHALRTGSPEFLARTLRHLLHTQSTPLPDSRDLLVALAPIQDCAGRLNINRVALFDQAVLDRPTEIADLVRTFARREDITPTAFDFFVEDTANGPRYRWGSTPPTS